MVLEKLSPQSVAEKLKALKNGPGKPHSTTSRLRAERHVLESLEAKRPIAWPKMNDESAWSKLDGAVSSRLHKCPSSLSERIDLL